MDIDRNGKPIETSAINNNNQLTSLFFDDLAEFHRIHREWGYDRETGPYYMDIISDPNNMYNSLKTGVTLSFKRGQAWREMGTRDFPSPAYKDLGNLHSKLYRH